MAQNGRPPDSLENEKKSTLTKGSTLTKSSTLGKRSSLTRRSTLPKRSTLTKSSTLPSKAGIGDDNANEDTHLLDENYADREDASSNITSTEINSEGTVDTDGPQTFQFGEIEFVGAGTALGRKTHKFVKVPKKADPAELLESLANEWNWGPEKEQPNLLISVTGGAWDFPINNHVSEVFRKGIVEAAVSANAWIITGGTDTGVMKYVGTAVGDYEIATRKEEDIVTIGIATWGTLRKDHKDELTRALKSKSNYSAKLSTKKASQKGVFLEQNHTHFILVDDGKRKFGADVKLRGNLEKEMSTKWKVPGLEKDLPMVCIVVEGGPNTIGQAHTAVQNDAPVVVVADSGRAANVLAKAFKGKKEESPDDIKQMLEKIIDNAQPILDHIEEILKKPNLLNVHEEKSKIKIDQMILRALIKANKNDTQVQLDLAQTWNRSDIVKYSEILGSKTDTLDWKAYNKTEETYRTNVHKALVKDQLGFIKLFLENNIVRLDTYLTKTELEKLYREVPKLETSPLFPLTKIRKTKNKGIEQKDDKLQDVEDILQSLTRSSFVFLSDDSKAGYDWYRSPPDQCTYQYVLPQIPEDRKTITFRVKVGRDACISLSSENNDTEDMYEIMLGYDQNEKCAIKCAGEIVSAVDTVSLLSQDAFRHFFISFEKGIQVGLVGEKPFMMCDQKTDIKFLGFRSGDRIGGIWEFGTFGYDQYETTNNYKYRYELPKIPQDKTSVTFQVKAEGDVYISLSSKKKDSDNMYEIVLSNNKSEIRLGKKGKTVAKASTSDLLSDDELRYFYITSEPDKPIQIGQLGEKPFMKYKHSSTIEVNYIGFSTDVGVNADWEFCTLTSNHYQSSSGEYEYQDKFLPIPKDAKMITFRVKTKTDAFIALSSGNKKTKAIYEIMLGLESNQKSGIRFGGEFKTKVPTEKLLSQDTFRHFYISFEQDIQVGLVGDKPFMKCAHQDKLDIKFLGFCTDFESTGLWELCTFGLDNFEISKYCHELPKVPKDRKKITFRVKAASDAHILLSSKNGDTENEYEIVLGGLENNKSAIILGKDNREVARELTPNLLSEDEFRHFYISIDPKKPIQVGLVGQKPLMKYKHSEPFVINHIGFCTGVEVSGEWEFCTFDFLDGDILPDPMRQLFLYSILNKFYETARHFWEDGQEHIAAALTASKIYKGIAKKQNSEVKETMHAIAKKYEDLAYDILTECEEQSEAHDTLDLLIRVSPNWGNANHLTLADATESLRFMSHDAVQTLLTKIWREGLPDQDQTLLTKQQPKKQSVESQEQEQQDGSDKNPGTRWKCLQDTKRFFEAPQTKFWINLLLYIVFLIYFTYVMVSDQLSKRRPSGAESFLIFWVVTFITEEIRQIAQPDLKSTLKKKGRARVKELANKVKTQVKEYASDYFNWIDITMLSLFVLGVFMRVSSSASTRSSARVVLAFSLFVFYLRFLHNLTLSRNIGPKVLMIFKMLQDLKFMVFILLIVLVGYGAAVQAILYPHVTDPATVAKGIFFRPAFQIFGELFLEDITADPSDGSCTTDPTAISLGADPCPEYVGWGVFFLVLYMILCNVLLLNMLIAMFSNTFQNVQDETDLHWKFQFYNLTKEYFNRPVLPPPLIIIVHIYRFVRYILHRCNIRRWDGHRMERIFSAENNQALIKMEQRCAYNYIRRTETEMADTSHERILARLKEVENQMRKTSHDKSFDSD